MKYAIVTAADKKYLPGVKALYASCIKNTTPVDFYLFAHGAEEDFKEVEGRAMKILYNKDTIASPISSVWLEEIPAMYSRLLIPRILSDYDRVLWLDADVLVLKDLSDLFTMDMEGHAMAGQIAHRPDSPYDKFNFMPFQFEEPEKFPEYENVYGIQAGVVLFDIKNWQKTNYDAAVDAALISGIKFKFVVQGLLGYVLKGDFKHIPNKWNAKISTITDPSQASIIHYVGVGIQNPWETRMRFGDLWQEYYRRF